MSAKNPTGRHNGTARRVLGYLVGHANVEIPYEEIQRELGLPSYGVSNAVTYLKNKGVPVTRPMNSVVIYRPNPHNRQTDQPKEAEAPAYPGSAAYYAALKRDVKLYEFVGKSAGRTIVRGEDDELYILSPLFTEDIPNGN